MVSDQANRETSLFQAAASGQTFLYDADGRLRFSGGITAARGHSGDNIGRSSIVSLVAGEGEAATNFSVLGCSLRGPKSGVEEGGSYGR